LQHAFELWVAPDIERRRQSGQLPPDFVLKAFQVVLPGGPDGQDPVVRLNQETRIVARIRSKGPVKAGDRVQITAEDLDDPDTQILLPPDEPNAAHFSALRFGSTWVYAFDFEYDRQRKAQSVQLLEAAKEFLDAARLAASQGFYRAAVDNMFSAAELSAKAQLVLEVAIRRPKTKHKWIRTHYASPVHRGLLTNLDKLRPTARYLDGPFEMSRERVAALLADLDGLVAEAERNVLLNQDSLPAPRHSPVSSRKHRANRG